jgi:NTE family protein
MTQAPDRTALVLSGGGAFGAFAVGVMKVLFAGRSPATGYQPLEAGILTGTSVGAFNAALLASTSQPNTLDAALRLEQIWLDRIADDGDDRNNAVFRVTGDVDDYLDPSALCSPVATAANIANDGFILGRYFISRTANFLVSRNSVRERIIGLFNLGSFIDSGPYNQLLHDVIHEENIRQSTKKLRIIATDWITGTAVRFRNSDFHDGLGIAAIMASTAIPGVFPPVRIGRDIYVDGGVVENTPLKPALDCGATDLHVIYFDPHPRYVPLLGEPNTLDTMLRVYHVMLSTKLNEDVETARWINDGLRVLEKLQQSDQVTSLQARNLIRVAAKILDANTDYEPITIHRYFPAHVLGGGLSALNFGLDRIVKIIQEGERTALVHDCDKSGCVVA